MESIIFCEMRLHWNEDDFLWLGVANEKIFSDLSYENTEIHVCTKGGCEPSKRQADVWKNTLENITTIQVEIFT